MGIIGQLFKGFLSFARTLISAVAVLFAILGLTYGDHGASISCGVLAIVFILADIHATIIENNKKNRDKA